MAGDNRRISLDAEVRKTNTRVAYSADVDTNRIFVWDFHFGLGTLAY